LPQVEQKRKGLWRADAGTAGVGPRRLGSRTIAEQRVTASRSEAGLLGEVELAGLEPATSWVR